MNRNQPLCLAALFGCWIGLACPQSFGATSQQAYVKALNNGESPDGAERFGTTVAISGDTMVVGAPHESSNATGVNGSPDPMGGSGTGSGAAYIYVRTGTNWTPQGYLKASDSDFLYAFGSAVAIDGNTVVVGAPGVDDGQYGAAYVFVRSGTNWTQQARLRPSNEGGDFGAAVSVSGDTIVIGAPSEGSSSTGVNGDETAYTDFGYGAAYVFVRSAGTWTQQAYLKASNAGEDDEFGVAVGISGDTVVVGARGEGSNATTVNGNQADNSRSKSGAAYVFVRIGSVWSQQAYLKSTGTHFNNALGSSVAIAGDTVVVGVPKDGSSAIGVNGDPFQLNAFDSGAAYVFYRSGSSWTQQAYLKASNTGMGDLFGTSVAVAGDTVVVGARDEDSNAAGNPADNSATNSGAAYAFTRIGSNWILTSYLKASNPGGGNDEYVPADAFGSSVAVSGDTVVIGAPGEDSNAAGVNGNQGDNSLAESGAAYVFIPPQVFSGYSSTPSPGSQLDFGLFHGPVFPSFFISNVGLNPLQITEIHFLSPDTNNLLPTITMRTCPSTNCPVSLPFSIASGPGGGTLEVIMGWYGRSPVSLNDILRVVCDDPLTPVVDYLVTGTYDEERQLSIEITVLQAYAQLFGASRQPGKLLPNLPQNVTLILDPNAPYSVTTEIPDFLGGGSVVLSNFTGSFTVTALPIPNDTNRAYLRVEGGSYTAPSFTLPSGLESGLNVLTFGPPEQSRGILYLTNGYYEVTATATITNNLLPEGVTVRGSYTGFYNFETGQANLQSDSRDLFVASDRVQLNYSPSGLWLTWINTNAVEEATEVTGPWRTLTNAVSPHLVSTTNQHQQFFRLRLPEP